MKDLLPVIRLGLSVLNHRLFKVRTPTNLMLSVTDRCNARCQYCGIPERARPEMNTEQILSLITEFRSLGGSRIALWGGEPLVRDDIGIIIRHCRKLRLLTSLDTNGHLVPQKLDDLRDLDVLVISFDGEEKIHDANREPGSWAKVMKTFAAACPEIPVWTITVLTKNNLGSIDYILRTAREYGFTTTWQVLHHQTLGSDKVPGMMPSADEYRKALALLMTRKKERAPIVNSLRYFRYIRDWPDYRQAYIKPKHKGLGCSAGQLYCNVDTDGRLFPCSVMTDLMDAKNVLTDGFKAAFDASAAIPCQACSAGCYIEYNYLYSLDLAVILNWFGHLTRRKK
jgi:MoaA/NifB/PqqE/SkfB family radical SAM enzyme